MERYSAPPPLETYGTTTLPASPPQSPSPLSTQSPRPHRPAIPTSTLKQHVWPPPETVMGSGEKEPLDQQEIDRNNELVLAAAKGDYAVVKQKIADGANVDARCSPPLGRFNNGGEEVTRDDDQRWLYVSSWLEGSIKVEKHNIARTALQAAADGGHKNVVELLISARANVNAPPAQVFGKTAMQAAAGSGYTGVVMLLKNSGADINASPAGQYGRTALQAAAEAGYEEMVAFLISSGADVNGPPGDQFGRTAIQGAAGAGWEKVVRVLMDSNADINAQPAESGGRTALQAAAERGHASVVGMLIDAKAEVNAPPAPSFGKTALEGAAEGGHEEVLRLLFKANVYIEGGTCDTILHNAVDDENRLKLLLKLRKFDVNAKDFLGSTPLHTAVKRLREPAVKLLMDQRAEADTKDISGETPLQTALEMGSGKILDILLKNGARTDRLSVDKYLCLLEPGDFPEGMCAVILREKSARSRLIERCTWEGTQITDLKDAMWTSPSICLFRSDSALELLTDTESFTDPQVYLKAYHDQDHPSAETDVRWSWLTLGDNRDYPAKFHSGILNSQAIKPEPNSEVVLVGYVSFTVPARMSPVPVVPTMSPVPVPTMKPFQFTSRKIEISWIMRESDNIPESAREPIFPFGRQERLRESIWRTGTFTSPMGPPMRSGTFNSTRGAFDKSKGSFLRSVSFRGTLKVKYLTIPQHGVEFFILYLDYIHQNWLDLIEAAKLHLVEIRDAQLVKGGRDPKITECLLKDSQQWNIFHADLSHHVTQSEEVLNTFKKNDVLYTELVDPDDWRESIGALLPIQELTKRIRAFEEDCTKRISYLVKETKEMIELEFSLVSIAEARRSIEMSMSMKRLSWITFIFLPLTFCSGLFGMNVNALKKNPSWLLYPAFAVPVLFSVLVVWIVFKYVPVGSWIETHIGKRIEAKLKRGGEEPTPTPRPPPHTPNGMWHSPSIDYCNTTTGNPESPETPAWGRAYLDAGTVSWVKRKSGNHQKDEEYNAV